METQTLKTKNLYCIKKGNKIKVSVIDPFPYKYAALDPCFASHE
jgi:hypothetical protein